MRQKLVKSIPGAIITLLGGLWWLLGIWSRAEFLARKLGAPTVIANALASWWFPLVPVAAGIGWLWWALRRPQLEQDVLIVRPRMDTLYNENLYRGGGNRIFTAELLSPLAGIPVPRVLAVLYELEKHGVIVAIPTGGWKFTHGSAPTSRHGPKP